MSTIRYVLIFLAVVGFLSCRMNTSKVKNSATKSYHGELVDESSYALAQSTSLNSGSNPSLGSQDTMMANSDSNQTIPNIEYVQEGIYVYSVASFGVNAAATDTPYMANCRSKGVPIPPDWQDLQWKAGQPMPIGSTVISSELVAQPYFYSDANGKCIALPRHNPSNNSLIFMGVICQSFQGPICIWDNVDPTTNAQISDPSLLKIHKMADATSLNGCANCHTSGFIIPDLNSPLAAGRILESEWKIDSSLTGDESLVDVFVDAPASWKDRVQVAKGSFGGDCNDCHEMKEPNPERCTVILSTINNGTMPPAGDSTEMENMYGEQTQSEVNDYFADSIRAIRVDCQNL